MRPHDSPRFRLHRIVRTRAVTLAFRIIPYYKIRAMIQRTNEMRLHDVSKNLLQPSMSTRTATQVGLRNPRMNNHFRHHLNIYITRYCYTMSNRRQRGPPSRDTFERNNAIYSTVSPALQACSAGYIVPSVACRG